MLNSALYIALLCLHYGSMKSRPVPLSISKMPYKMSRHFCLWPLDTQRWGPWKGRIQFARSDISLSEQGVVDAQLDGEMEPLL